jgi:hypothetical protein
MCAVMGNRGESGLDGCTVCRQAATVGDGADGELTIASQGGDRVESSVVWAKAANRWAAEGGCCCGGVKRIDQGKRQALEAWWREWSGDWPRGRDSIKTGGGATAVAAVCCLERLGFC